MPTDIIADVSIKKKVEELHLKICYAKKNFARAWVLLASNLRDLKIQMDEVGDRKLNWQTYVAVDSFEEYCEQKLDLDFKTGYQLIASLDVIQKNKPELLEDSSLTLPAWTKARLLSTKKAQSLLKEHPQDYQRIMEGVFDDKVSRRKLESTFGFYMDRNAGGSDSRNKEQDPEIARITSYFNNQKYNLIKYINTGNDNKLNQFMRGFPGVGVPISTRAEIGGIKRIVIANSAKKSDYAQRVTDRARKINPETELLYTGVGNNGKDMMAFPSQLQGAGNYWYMKETLYIRERKSAFIETFPSPGDIVENLNTALKLGFHCRSTCHYCYQQAAPYTYQEIFSNLEEVKDELKYEPNIHTATLTVWSLISHITKQTFNKIPNGLDKAIGKFRKSVVKDDIVDAVAMIQFLTNNITTILADCNVHFSKEDLTEQLPNISTYYKENQKVPLWLWVSEYSDILAIEPIAKQSEYIMTDLLDVNPDVNFMVSTKSAHGDCFLNHDGQNRVMLNMNLNPEQVIAKYETGTASLDERLGLVKKLQDKGGYVLRLSFEPMIYFDGWEQAYKDLVAKVAGSIDLSSIPAVVLGSIRLRNALRREIVRNYPSTQLFTNIPLEEASREDKRERYPEPIRIDQYRLMKNELEKHTKAEIILGAEYPEMWRWVGLDKNKFLTDSVYQLRS